MPQKTNEYIDMLEGIEQEATHEISKLGVDSDNIECKEDWRLLWSGINQVTKVLAVGFIGVISAIQEKQSVDTVTVQERLRRLTPEYMGGS